MSDVPEQDEQLKTAKLSREAARDVGTVAKGGAVQIAGRLSQGGLGVQRVRDEGVLLAEAAAQREQRGDGHGGGDGDAGGAREAREGGEGARPHPAAGEHRVQRPGRERREQRLRVAHPLHERDRQTGPQGHQEHARAPPVQPVADLEDPPRREEGAADGEREPDGDVRWSLTRPERVSAARWGDVNASLEIHEMSMPADRGMRDLELACRVGLDVADRLELDVGQGLPADVGDRQQRGRRPAKTRGT